jgi:hypothetical protein
MIMPTCQRSQHSDPAAEAVRSGNAPKHKELSVLIVGDMLIKDKLLLG